MTRFLARGLYSRARRRLEVLKRLRENPSLAQSISLKSIIARQRDTKWGLANGYGEIKTVKDFQKRVGLVRYLDVKPWIERCLGGEPNVLWPGRIKYFAITSGTTAKNKYIPVTPEAIASNRRAGFDCVSMYLAKTRDLALLDGPFLFLGGSTALKETGAGGYVGDLSGIMSKFIPGFFRNIYEPGDQIAHIPDWEEKLERIVQGCKAKDIRALSGVPSWVSVLCDRLLEVSGASYIKEIWKNLRLFVHGGMDFRPYKDLFRNLLGDDVYFLETYPASEGFMAIQEDPGDPALTLMLDYGIFYEFVPVEQLSSVGRKDRLTIEEVEPGKNYAIVLTTNSGLAGYILGDTVRFVSKDPSKIMITGRVEAFLNAFGEHVIVEELEEALSRACRRTGAQIQDYAVSPFFSSDRKEKSRHRWFVEFEKSPDDLAAFSKILDEVLCNQNDDYKTHRSERFGIGRPEVIKLARNAFYEWLKSEQRLGGQNKVPRIINDRDKVEALCAVSRELVSIRRQR